MEGGAHQLEALLNDMGDVPVAFSGGEGVDGRLPAMNLDPAGIAVSTRSACQADTREPFYVLPAMGCSIEQATGCLRFPLSVDNTEKKIDHVPDALPDLMEGLRH